jgi:flavin reductase (DIM6/NTAB) family NADH-FMN oxidoreductase RutF
MEKNVRRVDTAYKGVDQCDGGVDYLPAIAAMVTVVDKNGKSNILPLIAWALVSRFPFVFAIGVCHSQYTKNYYPRYTNQCLKEIPEFVLNIPDESLRDAISICGKLTGNKVDKFVQAGLTPKPSIVVRPPVIAECPVNYECKVIQSTRVGSHDVYFGEAVAVHSAIKEIKIDEDLVIGELMEGNSGKKLGWRSLPWWIAE